MTEIEELRSQIDEIDGSLSELFQKRMDVSEKIAGYKKVKGLPVYDPEREKEKLKDIALKVRPDIAPLEEELYLKIFELSKRRQNEVLGNHVKKLHCGLLGRKLGHSYSPQIHAEFGDYEYVLYEKEPEDVENFLKNGDFDGINVTIPYKKNVMQYCAELSETARSIGSVNTIIRRSDGTLYGDNTDAYGFKTLMNNNGIDPRGKKAVVLGSGGASATVCAVLRSEGARDIAVISRTGPDNYENIAKHYDAEIIINTTPVGMYPENGKKIIELSSFNKCEAVLDVVYNPFRTALLLQAEELGIRNDCGLSMLVAQAKKSSELFTGKEISKETERVTEEKLRKSMQNIILIGMPGSGKTTVASALSAVLGRQIIETDHEIEKLAGMSIPEIFKKYGETYFRELETQMTENAGRSSGMIISTGGGCVTRAENYPLLHQNGIIVWIRRDIEKLERDGRPVSLSSDMNELYRRRLPLYERFADYIADNNGSIDETVSRILEIVE